MGQKKLQRFGEIKTFNNVLEYPEDMRGQWHAFYKNNNPIILELACGKGEYTTGLAALYPQKNFLGVDVKGNRLWAGAKLALQNGLNNAAFLRTQISRIDEYFAPKEVDEIWITFPDPQLRHSKARKRLTHPNFLKKYRHFLAPGGQVHLKTDSPSLYEFTKKVIEYYQLKLVEDNANVHAQTKIKQELLIKTHYESLDIAGSNTIFYLCFSLPVHFADGDEKLHQYIKSLSVENQECTELS